MVLQHLLVNTLDKVRVVKKYVKKSMAYSPRELEVLEEVHGYRIRTYIGRVWRQSEHLHGAGQALAALLHAKERGLSCMVYAVREIETVEHMAMVDEEHLREALKKPERDRLQT